jgi:hypothetical protein
MAVNCLKDLIAKFFWNENDRCRFKLAHIRSYLWEEAFMRSFLMAALAAAGWPWQPRPAFTRRR